MSTSSLSQFPTAVAAAAAASSCCCFASQSRMMSTPSPYTNPTLPCPVSRPPLVSHESYLLHLYSQPFEILDSLDWVLSGIELKVCLGSKFLSYVLNRCLVWFDSLLTENFHFSPVSIVWFGIFIDWWLRFAWPGPLWDDVPLPNHVRWVHCRFCCLFPLKSPQACIEFDLLIPLWESITISVCFSMSSAYLCANLPLASNWAHVPHS